MMPLFLFFFAFIDAMMYRHIDGYDYVYIYIYDICLQVNIGCQFFSTLMMY